MFNLEKTKLLMNTSITHAIQTFSSLRAGAISIHFLDEVYVDLYGSQMLLKQVATVHVVDNFTLSIAPFDKSSSKSIAKAIQEANLGVSVVTDGADIKVIAPRVTEERRKELVKILKNYLEDAKISVRNVRRDGMDKIKNDKKDGIFSEDEAKRYEADVQKATDSAINELEKLALEHEKRLMQV